MMTGPVKCMVARSQEAAVLTQSLLGDEWWVTYPGDAIAGRHFDLIVYMPDWNALPATIGQLQMKDKWARECLNYKFRNKKTGKIVYL
jgi:hypothetical protein